MGYDACDPSYTKQIAAEEEELEHFLHRHMAGQNPLYYSRWWEAKANYCLLVLNERFSRRKTWAFPPPATLPRDECLKSPIRTGVRLTSDVAHVTGYQESVAKALHTNRQTGFPPC